MEYPAISPKWLESKGFNLITDQNKEWLIGSWDLNVSYDDGDLCYLENKLDRKQFCIVLRPNVYEDLEPYYDFEIYIREDIGCGFVAIPNQFCEMTEYHFSLLFEAIRREKL